MKKILLIFCVLSCGYTYTQELNEFELKSREKADLVFKQVAESQSKESPYILLSTSNSNYLLIIKRKTHYTKIKVTLDTNDSIKIESIKSLGLKDKTLEKAFNSSIYHKGFIGFQSEFYKNGYELSSGATTYFVMKDKHHNRFGESCLSVIIKPNPIDIEIYSYLLMTLIND